MEENIEILFNFSELKCDEKVAQELLLIKSRKYGNSKLGGNHGLGSKTTVLSTTGRMRTEQAD